MRTVTAIGVTLAGLVALAPARARACDIEAEVCFSEIKIETGGTVPAEGVIPIELVPARPGVYLLADNMLTMTTVAVTSGDVEVAGTLEAVSSLNMLVWRPAAPLMAGATYTVEVSVDNTVFFCAADVDDTVAQSFAVMATADPVPEPMPPELTAQAVPVVSRVEELGTMACCDGAYPELISNSCEETVVWESGECQPYKGFATLYALLTLDNAAVQAGRGQLGHTFNGLAFRPGATEAELYAAQPVCGKVTTISLATGATAEGPEVCVGQDKQDKLGERSLAVEAEVFLMSDCAGTPYTCELDATMQKWDPAKCTPWPDGAEPTTGEPGGSSEGGEGSAGATGGGEVDRGCACSSGDSSAPWGLAMLLAWRRRRGS